MKTDIGKVLKVINDTKDATKLKGIIANAKRLGKKDVEDAAFKKLLEILPSEKVGTVEHDFWKTIFAFEHALTEERGKTTRLQRTRQKVTRVGEVKTLEDWALSSNKTDGFKMLIERGMPELTGEAIVLRHPEVFDGVARENAIEKLAEAGVDVNKLA